MTLDRPILITGPPRSGKTCILHVLRQAQDVYAVEEPILLWLTSNRNRSDDCFGAEMASEAAIARINARCEQRVLSAGKQRYVDDLSYHALRLPFINAVMPDARVIFVIRNPMESVQEAAFKWTQKLHLKSAFNQTTRERIRGISLNALTQMAWRFFRNYVHSQLSGSRKTFGAVVPGMAAFQKNHSPVEVAAYQWSKMVEIALRDIESLPDLKVLEVRYDQLMADAGTQVERIAEFAEIQQTSNLITFAKTYLNQDHARLEQSCEGLSQADMLAIRRIVGPIAAKLGYSV